MKVFNLALVAGLFALTSAMSSSTHAYPIVWTLHGTITAYNALGGSPNEVSNFCGPSCIGSPYSLGITFESTTPEQGSGSYSTAVVERWLVGTAGSALGVTISSAIPTDYGAVGAGHVQIVNNQAAGALGFRDSIQIVATQPDVHAPFERFAARVQLQTITPTPGTAISSTAFPTFLPDASYFNSNCTGCVFPPTTISQGSGNLVSLISADGLGNNGELVGSITSISIAGQSQSDPLLPISILPDGTFVFLAAPREYYYDPVGAYGYHFQMTSGSLFTDILNFPTGFASSLVVSAPGCTIPGIFGAGMSVDFSSLCGGGVSSFDITGISPLVDASNPLAFPIQLDFNTPTADFTMTPLTLQETAVPEPASLLLIGLGALGMIWSRRRKS